MDFGLNSTDRLVAAVPFPVTDYYELYRTGQRSDPFCVGFLTNVSAVKSIKRKYRLLDGVVLNTGEEPTTEQVTDDSINLVLKFEFTDPEGTYTHIADYYSIAEKTKTEVDKNKNNKYDTMLRITNTAIGHIWEAFAPGTATMALSGANLTKLYGSPLFNFEDYWKAIAMAFNTSKNGAKIYENVPVRFKLVYDKDRLEFPSSPNFIEQIRPNINSILSVTARDKFIPPPAAAPVATGLPNNPVTPSGGTTGAFPWLKNS